MTTPHDDLETDASESLRVLGASAMTEHVDEHAGHSSEQPDALIAAIARLDDQAAFDRWAESYALAVEPLTVEGRRQDCKAAWDARGELEAEKLAALRAEIARLEVALARASKPVTAPEWPAPGLKGVFRCPRCGIDRTREPCPGPLHMCPVTADAQGVAAGSRGPGGFSMAYADSTPLLHVGNSAFEDWYQQHPKACTGDKQLAREAYAAGMGDPLVTYASTPKGSQA